MIRCVAAFLAFGLGVGLPAVPAAAEQAAAMSLSESLRVSFFFDRDAYRPGETARLKIVLTNLGDVELTGVRLAGCAQDANHLALSGVEGWGPLAERGPGMTIPATGSGFVAVSEVVPEAVSRWGYVDALCWFEANGHPGNDLATGESQARVPAVIADGGGAIYEDRNGNGSFDSGEGVAGVTVVASDQSTGAEVARTRTDGGGGFVITDVPAGRYDLRVDGPWKTPPNVVGWYEFQVVAGERHDGQQFAVLPGSEQENKKPKLVVTPVFEKTDYKSNEDVRVRVTVTNIGQAAAEGVRAAYNNVGPLLVFATADWGEFETGGSGGRIEAGATREIELVGTIQDAVLGVVTFEGVFERAESEIRLWTNPFRAVATVTVTHGTYAGILYGDANNNRVMDAGESLGGIPILLSGGNPFGKYLQLTDPQGRFAFRDLATGSYTVAYPETGGWWVPTEEVVVNEQDTGTVLVRAVRPLNETLVVSLRFTKNVYAVGEAAHLTVTLTNTGRNPITGITASCDAPDVGDGNENDIANVEAGWGPLTYLGSGVTLGAGTTATFDVWSTIPPGARNAGFVIADCEFGSPPGQNGNPVGHDTARVPGAVGSSGGRLIYDRNNDGVYDGDGVANTKLVLIDRETGRVMARSVTDAGGYFVFRDVPANKYEFRIIGPWKLASDGSGIFQVYGGEFLDGAEMLVIPGAVQPDPDAPPVAAPAPRAGVAPPAARRLATTGASVIELSAVGLVLFVMGLAMVLVFARRRRGA